MSHYLQSPVLSNFAVELMGGPAFSYRKIFPEVRVDYPEFKYRKFTATRGEMLRDDVNTRVSDRSPSPEIITSDGELASVSLYEDRLKEFIPQKKLRFEDQGMKHKRRKTMIITNKLGLRPEKAVRDLIMTPANFTLKATPTVKFDDPSSQPERTIDAGREAMITGAAGKEPNTIIFNNDIRLALKYHPDVREYLKRHNPDLLEMNEPIQEGRKLFGLNVIIPGALNNTANPAASDVFARLWTAKHIVLAYIDPDPDNESVTLGSTFYANLDSNGDVTYEDDGLPIVMDEWEEKDPRGVYVRGTTFQNEVFVHEQCGYMIQSALD